MMFTGSRLCLSPIQETWRKIAFHVLRNVGAEVDIEMLRPAEWVEALRLKVGRYLLQTIRNFNWMVCQKSFPASHVQQCGWVRISHHWPFGLG